MSPARPMRMRHVNGSATTAPSKVSVKRGIGQYLRISNLDGANNLQVSFDGGASFYTINSGDPPLEVNALFHYFFVQSDSSADYSALLGEG